MEANKTYGEPWFWRSFSMDNGNRFLRIVDKDNVMVCCLGRPTASNCEKANRICECVAGCVHINPLAVPELLEACEQSAILINHHKCRVDRHKPAGGGVCDVCQALLVLQSIIAKAKGQK